MTTSMTGRTYLLRGTPVTVTIAYNARMKGRPPCPSWLHWERPPKGVPRNVAVRFPDGSVVVRGFRGLRSLSAAPVQGALF